MRCPGQDRRYWTGEIAYEVPCPDCGATVEVFKDEPKRRCPQCGHKFQNPGMDFGCAQWCALAEQCLGFAPDRKPAHAAGDGALAGRLFQYLGEALKTDPARMAHVQKAYHRAKQLVSEEGGDPRIVVAATLLLGLLPPRGQPATQATPSGRGADSGVQLDESSVQPSPNDSSAGQGQPEMSGRQKARKILQDIGADEKTTTAVCEIVDCCHTGGELDLLELKIVRDAEVLASLPTQYEPSRREELAETIQSQLATDAAKRLAGSWIEAVDARTGEPDSEPRE